MGLEQSFFGPLRVPLHRYGFPRSISAKFPKIGLLADFGVEKKDEYNVYSQVPGSCTYNVIDIRIAWYRGHSHGQ